MAEDTQEILPITAKLNQVITDTPALLEKELQRSSNGWFECFLTRVAAIEAYGRFAEKKGEIRGSEKEVFDNNITKLREEIDKIKEQAGLIDKIKEHVGLKEKQVYNLCVWVPEERKTQLMDQLMGVMSSASQYSQAA